MKISDSGANIPSPPPINWATKPKPSPADIINQSPLAHVEDPGIPSNSRQLVPVFISPDHIPDLQEALGCLSDPAHRQPRLELHTDSISDVGNVQTVFYIGPPKSRQSQQDASNLPTEDQDLASSLSCLIMSTPTRLAGVTASDPVTPIEPVTPRPKNSGLTPLGMRTAPVVIFTMSSSATLKKRRYYVVLVGKCTGIYYDEWQVYYFFFISCLRTP